MYTFNLFRFFRVKFKYLTFDRSYDCLSSYILSAPDFQINAQSPPTPDDILAILIHPPSDFAIVQLRGAGGAEGDSLR